MVMHINEDNLVCWQNNNLTEIAENLIPLTNNNRSNKYNL